ncbi:MAG TPA: hypothetical protein VF594_11005, partial [Rubricoccaceae bacterium]
MPVATSALRARIAPNAQAVDVLYTDAPPPAAPGLLLKTVPVAGVTVATDPLFVAGGGRLVEVTLADSDVVPRRRFAFRARTAAHGVSAVSDVDVVPA